MRLSKKSFVLFRDQKKKVELLEHQPSEKFVRVLVDGKEISAKYRETNDGILLDTENRLRSFSFEKKVEDEKTTYQAIENYSDVAWTEIQVLKEVELEFQKSASTQKKGTKIKSQMPGKILKLLSKEGDLVKKGQTLMIMEAMKMENEIKAPGDGSIKKVCVAEGAAIESGALLFEIE